MTNQEAIKLIEGIRPKKCKMVNGRLQGGYPDHDSDIGKAIDMAIEVLEKQVPKKPIYTNKGTVTRCPVCEAIHFRCISSVEVDYCGRCGQAIDWSDKND